MIGQKPPLKLKEIWVISCQINAFFRSLGLMLTVGMSILDALPKAVLTIRNPILRNQFKPVILATENGKSLTEALTDVNAIGSLNLQLLLVGEKGGKLAETMLHFTKIKSENIELQEDSLAEWLPRLFYCLLGGCFLN